MVLGTIKLDLHKTNVLVSISFRLLDLFDYRRGKYQLLRRSMSNEIDLSLHWVTHLFYFPLVFTMSNTPLFFPLVFTFLFCFFCLSLICEISPKLLFVSCMPTDSEQEMANAYTDTCHATKTARNSTFAALKRVILEMNNIHPRAD